MQESQPKVPSGTAGTVDFKPLLVSNETLSSKLQITADALNSLATKDWNVNVSVPGGNASGDVVGAVNSRL